MGSTATAQGAVSPVALLIFNRPEETARVFQAVRAAKPSRLLVVADGPRADHSGDTELVERTREVVAAVDWRCDVSRLYSDDNMGCGLRVSSGLDWVFSSEEEAIILEDDCLPHADFFTFADTMLARYRYDERIGMIAGMNYFSTPSRPEAWFFTHYFAIWGWASWARAWRTYDHTMSRWPDQQIRAKVLGNFADPRLAKFMEEMLDSAHRGDIDTWDIQWVYSCLLRNRLCVVPRVNLISNIGYEGTRPPGPNLGLPTSPLNVAGVTAPKVISPDRDYEQRLYEERLRAPRPLLRERVADFAAGAAERLRRS